MIYTPKDTEVVVPISADNKPLKNTLNETTNEIEKESRKWDKAIDNSAQNMQKSFTKALDINRLKDWGIQAAKAITAFGLECVNAASDLQEVQNVVDVTFGNSAAEIDAWAKTAINQFGLSETKAKQFASTLGAMMKSAGLAGSEVVEMSEALSGLAADMSSFYNLDFDTAFQKIRSGISGETEPLKQLGINMSQANLQAFALEKGITKALDKMSQGEMVMLRYQYLMQATADAQGDFARTSDGYANSLRLLQSNLESIKTKIGSVFIGVLADATTSLNDFIGKMTQSKPRTILDEFADINLKTEEKLAEIAKTAGEAESLVGTLEGISRQVVNYQQSGNLVSFISMLSGNISGLDGALAKAKEGNMEGALDDLATALSKELGGDPDRWKNLLRAVADNAGDAIAATQGDTEKTGDFLENVADGAGDLTTDYSKYWADLLGALGDNAGAAVAALSGGDNIGSIIATIAGGANQLKDGTSGKWSAFAKALGLFDEQGNVPTTLQGVADALATNLGGDASKWETMLQAIGNNLPSVTSAVGTDGNSTSAWLTAAAQAADDLGGDYSENWKKLLVVYGENAGEAIKALSTTSDPGAVLAGIAGGANALDNGTSGKWSAFARALGILDDKGNVPQTIQDLAGALATNLGGDAKKWETMLQSISNNLGDVTTAVGNDGNATAGWLTAAAQAADDLGGDYSENWKKLLVVYGEKAGVAISALATNEDPGNTLSGIATGANKLNLTAPTIWRGLLGALTSIDGLSNIFNNGNAALNVGQLAEALSGNSPDTSKAEAWKTFLDALSENPGALTTLTETDAETTAAWLKTMADAVNEIDPSDADAWDKLFVNFVQGLPGLNDAQGGHAFFEAIAQEFLAMGNQSDAAREGLMGLGLSSEQVDTVQKQWLATCKSLVQTIPSLADVINTETGEVEGGTKAIEEHYKKWRQEQEKQLLWEAQYAKERALNERKAQQYAYQLDYITAQSNYQKLAEEYKKLGGNGAWNEHVRYGSMDSGFEPIAIDEEGKKLIETNKKMVDAEHELIEASKAYNEELKNNKAAEEEVANSREALTKAMGAYEQQTNNATDATEGNTHSLMANADAIAKAVDDTEKAVKAMKDYSDQVYKSSLNSIEGTLGGFNKVYDTIDAAKLNVQRLKEDWQNFERTGDAEKDAKKSKELELIWKNAENAIPSIQNMTEALDTQLKFLSDYYDNLQLLKNLGYTDDVIAMVSGGSAEDAGYAKALTRTVRNSDDVKRINKQVSDIKDQSSKLAGAMTANKLTIDEQFKELEKTAADAIAGLSQYDEAKKNVTDTMQGIIDGLDETQGTVKNQVQNILDMLGQLSGASYKVPNFNLNTGTFGPINPNLTVYSHLTLDGKQVATSVSEHQGNSLRTIQRSGIK